MKKITYILFALLAFAQVNAHGNGDLRSKTASCGYPWYGAGGHQGGISTPLTVQGVDLVTPSGKWVSTIRALPQFHMRGFVDNWIVVPETLSNNQTFTIRTEPTEQNFYYDSFFRLLHANGNKIIWSASGCFDWYVPHLGGKSQRKTACYDPRLSPTDTVAWLDLAHLCKLVTEMYQYNGLVDYIQVLNEWDFRWNVPYILKPQEYAVGFRMCYKAIRSVSKTQKIMIGATLTADLPTAKLLMRSIDSVFIINGETPPRDIIYTVNNYIRVGDDRQGNGIGATPESVDRYNVFFKPLNDFCKSIGIKFAITETGYNSSPSTSATAMKNKAPALEGYSLEEAQGILDMRVILILASLSECEMICIYHARDFYEAEPFTYHGLNRKDWSAKPARLIIEEYLDVYAHWHVQNFRQQGLLYGVDMIYYDTTLASTTGSSWVSGIDNNYIVSADTITLVWTDRNKHPSLPYDAKPRMGWLQPPNQSPTLTVTSPAGNATFTAPANVLIAVDATDADGFVRKVEFYQNNTLVATDSVFPYSYTATNLSAGNYQFRASAYDNLGLVTTINNINVVVNPPPTPASHHLTTQIVNGKKRIYWSDGQPAILSHADSPEGGLHPSWRVRDEQLSRALAARRANVRTYTLRGDDVTSVKPYSTGTTVDRAKMEIWKAQFLVYVNECKAKGIRPIFILYIGERTNWYRTLSEYQAWLSVFADVMKSGEDITGYFIMGIEEIGQRSGSTSLYSDNEIAAWWNPLNAYIKSIMPKCITMLHNNPNDKFWQATNPALQVDVICVQENNSAGGARTIEIMESTATDALNRGYAVHLHECYNCFQGSITQDTTNLKIMLASGNRLGCKCAAIFDPAIDTQQPDTSKNALLHRMMGRYLYGLAQLPPDTPVTNPPATQYPLHYALNSTLQPNNTLQGATLSAGKIWVYINVNSDIPNRPLKFLFDNFQINLENGRPYELNGGNGYNVWDGQHEVKVLNSQNAEIAKATFTVGTIVIPPDTTEPEDTVVVPPDTTNPATFVVEFAKNWFRNSATTVQGNTVTIAQGSYWWFVQTGTTPFTFTLKKNGAIEFTKTDDSPVFDFNNRNNWFFQRRVPYELIVTDGTGATRTIAITVN